MDWGKITYYIGDSFKVLEGLKEKSVHCAITSPPHWGSRSYNLPPVIWGGKKRCQHVWGRGNPVAVGGDLEERGSLSKWEVGEVKGFTGSLCIKCGAWRGQLGLEATPDLYVDHLVLLMREVRRVLRDDGTLFIGGQIGWTGEQKFESHDFIGQMEQALKNIVEIVEASGGKAQDITRLTWFILDKKEYLSRLPEVGQVYRRVLGRHFPAMSMLVVQDLIEDEADIEFEATAVLAKT